MMKKVIETERLYLREFTPSDTQNILELNSNAQVMKYMPVADRESATLEQSANMVASCIRYYSSNPGLGLWPTVLKANDAFIGWTCLKNLDDTDEMEIGYRYLPQFWGQGLCTEISAALLEYGFLSVGLERIVGISNPENKASRRVLEKLGLKYERDAHYYGIDVVYYALNRDEFR